MSLESRALSQFDQLVEKGELLWRDNPPRFAEFPPFHFEFRVASSLKAKPQNEEEKADKPIVAFQDKHPDFSLGLFGSEQRHKLILNKFCVVRPQFVLHTVDYEPQEDGLSRADFDASWDALSQMGEEYLVIFNGGLDAGASVGHKHTQVIPMAAHLGKPPFPTARRDGDGEMVQIEGLPYEHAVVTLPSTADDKLLHNMYTEMLSKFDIGRTDPHNILLTNSWMMVIPRSKAWIDEIAANATSMVGVVWCKSEAQYEGWLRRGIKEVLREMGKE